MSWKRYTAGAVALGLCVVGLRLGARLLFRAEESSHQSARRCGALTWRTTTVTRKSRFDAVPVLVREESVVEVDGKPVVGDVAHFQCALTVFPMVTKAAIVRNADGERANVSILGGSGELARVVRFEHDVESTWWAHEADGFAAVGPKGEISIAGLAPDVAPVVLAREKDLIGGRVTWARDGKSACFVTGKRPGAEPGTAELFCSAVPAPPVSVARAAWNGSGTSAPWVGFDGRYAKPHLCGEDLQPRDVSCLGIARPSE